MNNKHETSQELPKEDSKEEEMFNHSLDYN